MPLLPRVHPQQKIWLVLGGIVVGGSVFKIAYFRYCRSMLVEQADKTHIEATNHYKEAREFAAWSAKDREERRESLPELTPEQTKQMRAYLRMMQEHHALNPDSEMESAR